MTSVGDLAAADQWPGSIDLHLFNEGQHRRLWELLGAHVLDGAAGVRFSVWAPNAREIYVSGDWNGWGDGSAMRSVGSSGLWVAIVPGAAAGHRYKFAVVSQAGTTMLKADPMARQTECPPATASVVAAPSAHVWNDHEWMQARSNHPDSALRVYEVHLGSWRSGVTSYIDLAHQLAEHVHALGFTHIELMPVAEHPYGGSWGYQVSGYYAPTARFGTPDEFRQFIEIMHARGIGVIVDWVPAHFPRDEWSLAQFDGSALYEHADPRQGEHPDWGTLVFNFARNEVRNFLTANALYWLKEFHVDGLRVDAVASMLYLDYSREPGQWIPNELGGRENLAAVQLLQEVNTVVGHEVPGALMIAEESTAWPKVTHPVHHGGLGFTHKWNMGWMHDTLQYFEREPIHRHWHHSELTFGLLYTFTERYVLPLSHDEVVHGKGSLLGKMSGDDWQRFANLRALYAWMWALPGAPLLFMGGEIAPWTEWDESGGLPWHLYDHAPHRGVSELIAELNATADGWPALWEHDNNPASFQWLDSNDAEHSVYAFIRHSGQTPSSSASPTTPTSPSVVCIANLTPNPRPGYRVGVSATGDWQVLIDTDLVRFGGSSYRGGHTVSATSEVPWQGQPASAMIDLPALSVLWLGAPSK
ncbi:MAG: 1,4-alpha-glucan branching protein GlgB [Actinobacteria bacterium]|nr:1,4-alpha-glucan branching protein GlgB [Actinomycetota bacterium]